MSARVLVQFKYFTQYGYRRPVTQEFRAPISEADQDEYMRAAINRFEELHPFGWHVEVWLKMGPKDWQWEEVARRRFATHPPDYRRQLKEFYGLVNAEAMKMTEEEMWALRASSYEGRQELLYGKKLEDR